MWQTGNDNLIWLLSWQQDNQIWQIEMNMPENCWFLHNWRMKITFSRQKWKYSKSVFHRLVNLFTVRFSSSWDHYIVLKTVSLERSTLGWGEGCPMLWRIYAWHFIVMKILYKSMRIKNKKYNELNKAMHNFVGVLDKYGWGGIYVCPLSEFHIRSFPILRSRPCSSAWLVFTHVAISSSLMLLFQGHVAKKCVIMGCTYVWSSSEILGVKFINNYTSNLNGLWVNSPWGWRPNRLLTQRPSGQEVIVLVKSN